MTFKKFRTLYTINGFVIFFTLIIISFCSICTIYLNDKHIYHYKQSFKNYYILKVKNICISNINIFFIFIQSSELVQHIFNNKFSEQNFHNFFSPTKYTFWRIITLNKWFISFLNTLYKNTRNKIYFNDEESLFPLCANSTVFHKSFFSYFFYKQKKNTKYYMYLKNILCTVNTITLQKMKKNLKKISVYNPLAKINLISSPTKLVWAMIKTCLLKQYTEIKINDINGLRKFSALSGKGIIDTFIRTLLKEHSLKDQDKQNYTYISRCITNHLTITSKYFHIKIKAKKTDIIGSVVIIISVDKRLLKIHYFTFRVNI